MTTIMWILATVGFVAAVGWTYAEIEMEMTRAQAKHLARLARMENYEIE